MYIVFMSKLTNKTINSELNINNVYNTATWIYNNYITEETTLEGFLRNERDIETLEDLASYIEKLKCIEMEGLADGK